MRLHRPLTLLPLILVLTGSASARAQFTFTTNNGAITVTRYTGSRAAVVIPGTTNGFPITGIGEGAFLRCSSLTNVLLPDSIVTIGDSAFASCFGLATINFPANLATIGGRAFEGCKLTKVVIPQSVTNIGYCAFAGCSALEQFTVERLNPCYCDLDGVLFNQNRTTVIQCPPRKSGSYWMTNTVTSIGDFAFSGSALQNIDIPAGVTNLGRGAFKNATTLTNIGIPDSITGIGIQALSGCSNLLSLSIPDGVTSIGWYTFFRCSSLTNINIGLSVTRISESAFYGCSSLTHVAIPDSVTNLDLQAFVDCSGLRSVWVGKGVANIGDSAFLGCVNLAGIYFPVTPLVSVPLCSVTPASSCITCPKPRVGDRLWAGGLRNCGIRRSRPAPLSLAFAPIASVLPSPAHPASPSQSPPAPTPPGPFGHLCKPALSPAAQSISAIPIGRTLPHAFTGSGRREAESSTIQ
jgi:hypothetical protein